MDKIKNPFSPGAGSPPPELAGRDGVLDEARVLLGRVKQKRSEKSILLFDEFMSRAIPAFEPKAKRAPSARKIRIP